MLISGKQRRLVLIVMYCVSQMQVRLMMILSFELHEQLTHAATYDDAVGFRDPHRLGSQCPLLGLVVFRKCFGHLYDHLPQIQC